MKYNNCDVCFKLESDGSVREIKKEDTLFGKIPPEFSPSYRSGIPSPVYAMRNYGYMFIQDTDKALYRMDPVSGAMENLEIDIESIRDFAFFHNMIYLEYKNENHTLFNLSDKSEIPTDHLLTEGVCDNIFSSGDKLFHCDVNYKKDPDSGNEIPCLFARCILPDGSSETLYAEIRATSKEESAYIFEPAFEEESPYWDTRPTVCLIDDHFYCFAEKGTEYSLIRIPVGNNSDIQTLACWTTLLTASPSVMYTEKYEGEVNLGKKSSVSYSVKQLFLREQTDADRSINRALSKIYAGFEEKIDDTIQREKEYEETTEYTEYTYHPDDVLSFSIFCNYMDDNTISFDCFFLIFLYTRQKAPAGMNTMSSTDTPVDALLLRILPEVPNILSTLPSPMWKDWQNGKSPRILCWSRNASISWLTVMPCTLPEMRSERTVTTDFFQTPFILRSPSKLLRRHRNMLTVQHIYTKNFLCYNNISEKQQIFSVKEEI